MICRHWYTVSYRLQITTVSILKNVIDTSFTTHTKTDMEGDIENGVYFSGDV